MGKRVVLTGMGIWSCLGTSLDEVCRSLYDGKSGIILDPQRKEMGFRSGLTGQLPIPELKGELPRSQRVYMPQQAQFAYCATRDALRHARIDQDYLDHHEVGILYGNDSTADAVYKSVSTIIEKKDTMLCGSGAIFQSMNSTVTMNLSVIFRLKGINLTVSGACASGSHAIGLGALLIRNCLQDMVVCGGAQEVNAAATGSFDGISAFSTRESEPEKASRPFDRDRDGLIPGGGAATVILESYESAVRRGAPILAEVLGYGFSSNGEHISTPNVDGPRRALEMSVREAGISLDQLGYINAHATSTQVGDANEAKAIYSIIGKDLQADAIGRLTQAFMDRLEESTQGTFQDLSRSAVEGARMQKESAEAVKALVDGFSGTLSEMREISQAQKAILDDMKTATEDLRSTISLASVEMQKSIKDASDAMKTITVGVSDGMNSLTTDTINSLKNVYDDISKSLKNISETQASNLSDLGTVLNRLGDHLAEEKKILEGHQTSWAQNYVKADEEVNKNSEELLAQMTKYTKSMTSYTVALNEVSADMKVNLPSFEEMMAKTINDIFELLDKQLAEVATTLGKTTEEINEAAARLPKALRGLT